MTREEAINTVRNIYQTDKEKEALSVLVPELRESEDEKIRKALIQEFKKKVQKSFEWKDGIPNNAVLNWLEKQKEQEMVNLEIPAGDVALAEEDGPFDEDEFLEGELSAFLQNYDKEYDDDAAVSDVARHFYEIGKKQKEQKPAEKQDYSGLTDLERAIHRGFLSAGVENVPVTIIKQTAKECLAQMKPAEWSEEDEKHINLILRVLDIQQCWDGATGKMFNPYQDEIDWLKSLRPSWKPSEEQMNYLCNAVDAAIRKHNESVSGYEPARVLKSLYEDLKKL